MDYNDQGWPDLPTPLHSSTPLEDEDEDGKEAANSAWMFSCVCSACLALVAWESLANLSAAAFKATDSLMTWAEKSRG